MSAQLWPPLQPSGGLAEGRLKSAQLAAKDGLSGLDWHQIGYLPGTSLIVFGQRPNERVGGRCGVATAVRCGVPCCVVLFSAVFAVFIAVGVLRRNN